MKYVYICGMHTWVWMRNKRANKFDFHAKWSKRIVNHIKRTRMQLWLHTIEVQRHTFGLHSYTKLLSSPRYPSFQHNPTCIPASYWKSKHKALITFGEIVFYCNTNQFTHSLPKYDFELCLFVWPWYLWIMKASD